jgi:hypothetical protein
MHVPYSGNFTSVTVVTMDRETGGPVLQIEGRSQEPQRVKQILVAVPHRGELLTASVQNVTAADWSARIPQPDPPIAGDEAVIVVGVAMLKEDPPFFWADRLNTDPEEAPPP